MAEANEEKAVAAAVVAVVAVVAEAGMDADLPRVRRLQDRRRASIRTSSGSRRSCH